MGRGGGDIIIYDRRAMFAGNAVMNFMLIDPCDIANKMYPALPRQTSSFLTFRLISGCRSHPEPSTFHGPFLVTICDRSTVATAAVSTRLRAGKSVSRDLYLAYIRVHWRVKLSRVALESISQLSESPRVATQYYTALVAASKP